MADEAVLNYVLKGKNTKMTHKKGKKTVLGIRDFLMRIRIHRSVLVTNGSGSDSFLRDFEDREDTKKNFCIPHIFPYNLTTGTLSSVFCKNFVFKFSFASIISEKGKDQDPHLWQMDPHAGGLKTSESGSPRNFPFKCVGVLFCGLRASPVGVGYGTLPEGPGIKELHLLKQKL
jgi:hypothetical protein